LFLQAWLPLVDSALHRHTGDTLVSGDAQNRDQAPKSQPGHAKHDCAICQFMSALGSFNAPSATALVMPVTQPVGAASARTLPRDLPQVVAASQARAPPTSI
jgi:hypothetical protein